jgi:hypothetical protein
VTERRIDPDPYPSGIYSTLSYPSPGPPAAGSASPADTDDVVARIGDIDLTRTALRTPAGEVPLAAASVEVTDDLLVRTPAWAVACAIVGFFVVPVLSLLFLLFRETVPSGAVRCAVTGNGVRHETVLTDPAEIELARSLAAS